ncbi:4-hydroxybenzoyl-thioesterase [Colletotrichum incanum]|nr:4-hydroxybenzoyl-thioesterase [Colletotrichum incanum]
MRNPIALGARLARVPAQIPRRSFATSARCLAAPSPAPANGNGSGNGAALNPRWLSELQARIKRCAGLGLQGQQKEELKALREAVDGQWLELLAGREGFLTGPGWRGLDRHTVTWGDQHEQELTVAGHVNNVVYNKYAESARFNWLRNFATTIDPAHKDDWNAFMTPRDIGLIMRSIKTDYKFPMAYPDHITVLHKLVSKPTYESDYILLEALLISHGHRRPAARCFEDIVVYDYKTAKRTPLKPFMVDRLRETYEAQDKSKAECEKKVQSLVEVVERLERAA